MITNKIESEKEKKVTRVKCFICDQLGHYGEKVDIVILSFLQIFFGDGETGVGGVFRFITTACFKEKPLGTEAQTINSKESIHRVA